MPHDVLVHKTIATRDILRGGRLEARRPEYGADVKGVFTHLLHDGLDPGYMARPTACPEEPN